MTRVFFSNSAEHDLKRLPGNAKELLREEHIPKLAANLRIGKSLHGPLRGYFSYEFWASGVSYRIAYEVIKGDVVILLVDKGDNFYNKFLKRVR